MTRQSLSQEDWIAAGFRLLASSGPTALQINVLAKSVKATKGSFYWHFKDIAAFKSDMLALWQDKVATDIIARVMEQTDPIARWNALLTEAAQPAPDEFGGRSIEPAMRAWALSDPDVAAMLSRIDATRTQFLSSLLREMGKPDPDLAELVYAAYLGLDDLAAKGQADISKSLAVLNRLIGL